MRVADGPPQRIGDKGQQHLPGEEAWLIGEHRMSGEKKYYLAYLPAKTDLRDRPAWLLPSRPCVGNAMPDIPGEFDSIDLGRGH